MEWTAYPLDDLALTDAVLVVQTHNRDATDALPLTDSYVQEATYLRSFIDDLVPVDSVQVLWVFEQSFIEDLAPTDSLNSVQQHWRQSVDTTHPHDALVQFQTYNRVLPVDLLVPRDTVARTHSAMRSPVESMNVDDDVVQMSGKAKVDAMSMGDSVRVSLLKAPLTVDLSFEQVIEVEILYEPGD